MSARLLTCLLFLSAASLCGGHPLDEGQQQEVLQITPTADGLRLDVSVLFDDYASDLLLRAHDLDQDGAFSEKEAEDYATANLEQILDLIEVSAGRMEDFFRTYRKLPRGLELGMDQNRDGQLSEQEYFELLKRRAPEQVYLFTDRVEAGTFQLAPTNATLRVEKQGPLVAMYVSADYPWPARIPRLSQFTLKVEVQYKTFLVASSFALGPLPPDLTLYDRISIENALPDPPFAAERFQEPAFSTLPRIRRCALLLELPDVTNNALP